VPVPGGTGHWWFRFSVMLALSVVIAVLGLSLDSDAVMIGAMLVAPLMTPLIGTATAPVMGWPRRLAQAGLAVLAGSARTSRSCSASPSSRPSPRRRRPAPG
jgi:uncharacterized membrane protein